MFGQNAFTALAATDAPPAAGIESREGDEVDVDVSGTRLLVVWTAS
jgi:hypothetical protein